MINSMNGCWTRSTRQCAISIDTMFNLDVHGGGDVMCMQTLSG